MGEKFMELTEPLIIISQIQNLNLKILKENRNSKFLGMIIQGGKKIKSITENTRC